MIYLWQYVPETESTVKFQGIYLCVILCIKIRHRYTKSNTTLFLYYPLVKNTKIFMVYMYGTIHDLSYKLNSGTKGNPNWTLFAWIEFKQMNKYMYMQ